MKFTREEIMKMCHKDIVNIHVPKREENNRFMGLPIIELEFDKDILDLHIIIGEESI